MFPLHLLPTPVNPSRISSRFSTTHASVPRPPNSAAPSSRSRCRPSQMWQPSRHKRPSRPPQLPPRFQREYISSTDTSEMGKLIIPRVTVVTTTLGLPSTTAAPAANKEKRAGTLPPYLAAFASQKVSSACSCLSITPAKTTIQNTATVTPAASVGSPPLFPRLPSFKESVHFSTCVPFLTSYRPSQQQPP